MKKKNKKLSFYDYLKNYTPIYEESKEAINVILNDPNFPKQETKKTKIIEYLDTKEGDVSYNDGCHAWCCVDYIFDKYKPIKKISKKQFRKVEFAGHIVIEIVENILNEKYNIKDIKQIRDTALYREQLDILKKFVGFNERI